MFMQKLASLKAKKRKGFSFMEILVALTLIVSLSVGAFFMFNEAQQTRKMAQMNNDMDAIVNAALTYEALSLNSTLPADMTALKAGLVADKSIDGVAHTKLLQAGRSGGAITDPWGAEYVLDGKARTLTCNAKDANGAPMTPVVRNF